MMVFTPKKLPLEETVGEKLRQARHYKKLQIKEVAKTINIRSDYLTALEEEHFDKLPSGLYGKKFLKYYASFLGLKSQELLKKIDNLVPKNKPINPFYQKIVKKNKFIIFPKIFRNFLIITIIIIFLLYLIIYFKQITFPPKIIIFQPEKNILIKNTVITVIGQTESGSEVKINGEIILNNHNGNFSQTVNLKKGLNNVIITSKKKYSQESLITRQILVQ